MTDISFDPLPYLRTSPNMTLESGILLGQTLAATMPKGMPPHVKKAAQKLSRVVSQAQSALAQRQKELGKLPEQSTRELDNAADQIWAALRDALDAVSRLPASCERARKAKKLLIEIFPEGTTFLRLSFAEQFVQMDTILKRIDQGGLAKAVDALVGPEFLLEIRAVHPRYAAMVASRLKQPGPADSLLDHLRSLQRSIVEYATAVASTIDSEDETTLTQAVLALRPIDNHRQQLATGKRVDPTPPDPPAAPNPSAGAPHTP